MLPVGEELFIQLILIEYLMPSTILGTRNTTQNTCPPELYILPEKHEEVKQDTLKCFKMMILKFILSIRIMMPPPFSSCNE